MGVCAHAHQVGARQAFFQVVAAVRPGGGAVPRVSGLGWRAWRDRGAPRAPNADLGKSHSACLPAKAARGCGGASGKVRCPTGK